MVEKIKEIFGKKIIIEPIIDFRIYKQNEHSYTGNSLANSNLLIVSQDAEDIEKLLETENCFHAYCRVANNSLLTVNDIILSGDGLIGPFDHVLNIYRISETDNYNEWVRSIYKNMQIVTEYMIKYVQSGTICTVLIYEPDICLDAKASLRGLKSMIAGLGLVHPKHGITSNGIIASSCVPCLQVYNTALYMSSKYGQILSGEVFEMDK
jgi:hypothetical protein